MKLLQNMKEVLKTLSYQRPSKIYCPRCGSSKLTLSSRFDYWLTPKKYVCKECGYVGPIVMEMECEET